MAEKFSTLKFEGTPEMMAPTAMPMEITLPKVIWLALAQMAKESGVEMDKIFQRIFEAGLENGPIVAMFVVPKEGAGG